MRSSGFRWRWICAALVSLPGHAADVGGWFTEQQRTGAAVVSNAAAETCAQVIARAALDSTGIGAYHAALCHLQSDTPDLAAAQAWLSRAVELNFLPAHRLMRALQAAEAGLHSPMAHCHDLGEGRRICHGEALAQPVAAAPAN